ncbi:MAG: hypothetical protein FWE61_04485 [Micrococcales bacterium]|nr:hypothetical protein [Micrococcales bacterium]
MGTAMNDTLERFMQFYEPGTANGLTPSGEHLLMIVLTDLDPDNRGSKANYLLDDGADPKWCTQSGLCPLHVLLDRIPGNVPCPRSDVALLTRLLDGGADINAVDRKYGTPVQVLLDRAIRSTEEHLGPVYEVVFGRPGLDLFRVGAYKKSSYRIAWQRRERLTEFWARIEQYVADHGLVVPDGEVD